MPCQGLYGCSKNAVLSATRLPFSPSHQRLSTTSGAKKPARSRAVTGPIKRNFSSAHPDPIPAWGKRDAEPPSPSLGVRATPSPWASPGWERERTIETQLECRHGAIMTAPHDAIT